jgi:hypothetical protein
VKCFICKVSEATVFVNANGEPTKRGKCEGCHARAIRNSIPKQKRGKSPDRRGRRRESGEKVDRDYHGDMYNNGEW